MVKVVSIKGIPNSSSSSPLKSNNQSNATSRRKLQHKPSSNDIGHLAHMYTTSILNSASQNSIQYITDPKVVTRPSGLTHNSSRELMERVT